jgi:tetratricopeptide (TPR) repeat protein
VNKGHVFAGDIGPFYRRTYTIMGDAVNLSARLMAKATAGQIITTDAVLQPSHARFKTTALEPFFVKGKSQPIEAFVVGPRAEAPARAAQFSAAPLVGRNHELSVLTAALDSARREEGRVVEIVGDAGIGKSRLIEELRKHAGGVAALTTSSELYQSSTPYAALTGVLRRVFAISDLEEQAVAAERLRSIVAAAAPHLLPWVPLLGIALDVTIPPTPEVAVLDDEFRRTRLEEVTVELLTTLLRAPTLFVFDDAHWMDEASADLLRRLSGEVPSLPWVVVVGRRDSDQGFSAPAAPHVETLRPEPLDAAAASELVEAETEENPLAPHEISALAQRSGGNPLFLLELLAAARDVGDIEGLPDTVEALITARIDRLPAREKTVLKRLSVLGLRFHGELARAVIPPEVASADEDDAWERLEEFIAPDGPDAFRFRQTLIRDAAYDGLPFRVRQSLHALVGETIERAAGDEIEESAEILSLHFYYARRFDQAWRYSRVAADRAVAIYANIEAAEFYERAIDSSKRLEKSDSLEIASIYESLGDVRKRMGEFPRATQAYAYARRIFDTDAIATARLMLKQAGVRQASGRFSDAIRWIRKVDRALAGREGADAASQRAQTAVAYASVRKDQGRQSDVIKWCLKAIAEAEAAEDKDALAHAYTLLESAFVNLGMWEKAVYSGQALGLYEDLGDLWGQGVVLNNSGARAYFEGRWNEAINLYERGREAWEKIGDAVSAAIGTVNAGEILSDQGRLDEAEANFRKAARVWKAAGDRASVAYATSNLGRLAYRRGDCDAAAELLEEARSEFSATGAEADAMEAEARLAECYLYAGRFDDALKLAEDLLARTKAETETTGPLTPMLFRLQGSALVGRKDLSQAHEALERSLAIARDRNARYDVALALGALASWAEASGEQADRYLEERKAILDGLGVVSAADARTG